MAFGIIWGEALERIASGMPVRYLDLTLMINGSMDAFILIFTARLLNFPVRPMRILGGVLLGEIPVIMALYSPPLLLAASKFLIPLLMVGVSIPLRGFRNYVKGLLGFWLFSAGLGGFIYALWGWTQYDGYAVEVLNFGLKNLWLLPLAGGLWWASQVVWQKLLTRMAVLKPDIYDLEIDFGDDGKVLNLKALLDTGNQLRDPLTGAAVILVEEEVAVVGMPEKLRNFLQVPWQDYEDPWPWLWKENPLWMQRFVFIPFQSIGKRSYLLGVRPQRVVWINSKQRQEVSATLALVKQVLSPDGAYQALLHPEHIQKGGG